MTNHDDITVKAEVAELKAQLADALNKLAKYEGATEQLNKSIAAGNRMTNWQFIGFVVVMAGTLLGSMYWAAGMLESRIEQTERHFSADLKQTREDFNTRLDQMEKNMNARFEDLRQVVLSKR